MCLHYSYNLIFNVNGYANGVFKNVKFKYNFYLLSVFLSDFFFVVQHVIYLEDSIVCSDGILRERVSGFYEMVFILFWLWSAYRVLYTSKHFLKDFINISGFGIF